MKHIGKEIERIIRERGIVKLTVAKNLGITPTWLSKIFAKESIDCALLDRICREIGVPAAYFFDDENSALFAATGTVVANNAASVERELAMLRELVRDKERTIQILLKQSGQERDNQ